MDAVIGLCGAPARRVGGRYTWVKGWSKFGMLNNVCLSPIASLPFSLSCSESCRLAMAASDAPDQPSLLWRTGSSFITGATGFLCRTFLVGLNRLEVKGYDKFMRLLDEREDVSGRTKGLITGTHPSSALREVQD